ncbi:MAG: DUF4838 domain-containing protein [Clostridia bacterium]|nr:DUF4838 domain-containing protein [Clostridia bacterium]
MKRRIIISFFCIILAILFSLSGFACKNKNDSGKNGEGNSEQPAAENIVPTDYNEISDYTEGLHIFNKTATEKIFIKEKQTDYVIVIPNEDNETVSTAAAELTALLQEAAGVNMAVYRESALPANSKYISLGDTALSYGVLIDTRINSNGYIIKTSGENIYIKSKGDHGVLWGVYEFLAQTVGYNCVAYNEWSFDADTSNVPLYDLDIVDSPDFELRIANNGCIYNNESLAHKYRFLLPHRDVYLQDSEVEAYHNFFEYIPKRLYESTHDKWYSVDGTQLCLTAHGDKAEYDALVNAVAERMEAVIQKDTMNRMVLTFTQQDINTWCECDHCRALKNKYGTDSASLIMFMNDVVPKVEAWKEVNYPEKDVTYSIFAYQRTLNAPAKKNADGTFSPIDQNVVCHPKMSILYAPLYQELVYGVDQPENKAMYDNIMAWRAVCETFGYWGYTVYYTHTNLMYNCFTAAQDIYKFLLNELNPRWIFDQGQNFAPNHTGFIYFKMYLESQWQWDVNRDYRELKKNFFRSFYREAAEPMMKFYEEYATHMYHVYKEMKQGMTVYSHVKFDDETFPFRMIQQWLGYIEEAKEAVKKYEDENAPLYKILYERINLESISPRYIIWKCHKDKYSTTEWEAFIDAYNRDADMYGIKYDIVDG